MRECDDEGVGFARDVGLVVRLVLEDATGELTGEGGDNRAGIDDRLINGVDVEALAAGRGGGRAEAQGKVVVRHAADAGADEGADAEAGEPGAERAGGEEELLVAEEGGGGEIGDGEGFGERVGGGVGGERRAVEGGAPGVGHSRDDGGESGIGAREEVFEAAVDDALGGDGLSRAEGAAGEEGGGVASLAEGVERPEAGDPAAEHENVELDGGVRHGVGACTGEV